jgi:hypothetical protein
MFNNISTAEFEPWVMTLNGMLSCCDQREEPFLFAGFVAEILYFKSRAGGKMAAVPTVKSSCGIY